VCAKFNPLNSQPADANYNRSGFDVQNFANQQWPINIFFRVQLGAGTTTFLNAATANGQIAQIVSHRSLQTAVPSHVNYRFGVAIAVNAANTAYGVVTTVRGNGGTITSRAFVTIPNVTPTSSKTVAEIGVSWDRQAQNARSTIYCNGTTIGTTATITDGADIFTSVAYTRRQYTDQLIGRVRVEKSTSIFSITNWNNVRNGLASGAGGSVALMTFDPVKRIDAVSANAIYPYSPGNQPFEQACTTTFDPVRQI
jgi:hypothetical protein